MERSVSFSVKAGRPRALASLLDEPMTGFTSQSARVELAVVAVDPDAARAGWAVTVRPSKVGSHLPGFRGELLADMSEPQGLELTLAGTYQLQAGVARRDSCVAGHMAACDALADLLDEIAVLLDPEPAGAREPVGVR
jgi:hypothetical protein